MIIIRKKYLKYFTAGFIIITAAVTITLSVKIIAFIEEPLPAGVPGKHVMTSLKIFDRQGILLSEFFPDHGGRFVRVKYSDLPKNLIDAVVSLEDKRFFAHPGFDIKAILRAFIDNFNRGKIISGGSTITQQLVRFDNRIKRNYRGKIKEILLALRYEHHLRKKEILLEYLNRAFFGNNIYGVGAASETYLGKHISRISPSESAFLAGLLKSGTKYNPYRYETRVEKRRLYVLGRMKSQGFLSGEEHDLAVIEKIKPNFYKPLFRAPHFSLYVKGLIEKAGYKNPVKVVTTLDFLIQEKIENVIKNNVGRLKELNVSNASVVVLDAGSGDLLSMFGSLDYFDGENAGKVNGALALRQPGSSLKPFLYAYVFSKGNSPASVIADVSSHFPGPGGDYTPENFDWKYHGPVNIRQALAGSYNIPAVKWLSLCNGSEYLSILRQAGLDSIRRSFEYYGLGIALGTAEVSLLKLAGAYTVFTNDGVLVEAGPVKYIRLLSGRTVKQKSAAKKRVLSAECVYMVNHILSDRNARLKAFPSLRGIIYPFDIAMKTGTSKDYRDAWVIGYTPEYIVGIWLGNFNGESMNRITGGSGGVPLLYDIFLELNPGLKNRTFGPAKSIIKRNVCPVSGLLANEHCPHQAEEIFTQESLPVKYCPVHRIYEKTVKDGLVKKLFTVLPAEYSSWIKEKGIEIPGKEWRLSADGENKYTGADRTARIIYPDDGDVFRIDPVLPVEFQKIELNIGLPDEALYIEWYFDGALWKQVNRGQVLRWQLNRGKHRIHARVFLKDGSSIVSNEVNILVQ